MGLAQGTNLLTPAGYRPIESLRSGDRLLTALDPDPAGVPIAWIGKRVGAPNGIVRAVLVRAHAIEDGVPRCDVLLAPEHGIYIDGKFYLPRQLANGASIVALDAARVFWAVELPRHDVVSANGLKVESYLDEGGRSAFATVAGPRLRVVNPSG